MHQINTIPELNGKCKASKLKRGQHKINDNNTKRKRNVVVRMYGVTE